MAGNDSQCTGRLEVGARLIDEVTERSFGHPRCRHQLDPLSDRNRTRFVQYRHVVRLVQRECVRSVDRRSVERIVIARQQVEGHLRSGSHCVQCPNKHLAVDLVGFEYVAAHEDKLATLFDREFADTPYRVESRSAEPRLRLSAQKMTRHSKLPVGCVNELHGTHSTQRVSWSCNEFGCGGPV